MIISPSVTCDLAADMRTGIKFSFVLHALRIDLREEETAVLSLDFFKIFSFSSCLFKAFGSISRTGISNSSFSLTNLFTPTTILLFPSTFL